MDIIVTKVLTEPVKQVIKETVKQAVKETGKKAVKGTAKKAFKESTKMMTTDAYEPLKLNGTELLRFGKSGINAATNHISLGKVGINANESPIKFGNDYKEIFCNEEMLKNLPETQDNITTISENAVNEVELPRHISTINEHLEGKKHPEADVEYKRKTFVVNGELVEGVFPEFDSKFNIDLPKELEKASDLEQFKYCTKKLAEQIENDPELASQFTERQIEQIKNGEPRISGLTWHHNEVPGKMQLVDAETHSICRHTGGRNIWGGGNDKR